PDAGPGPSAVPAPGAAARVRPRRSFRERYVIVYDTSGPKVRRGVGWALLVAGSLTLHQLRPWAPAALFGIAAGWAALQIVDCWRVRHPGADRWVAAVGAAALPLAAAVDARVLGAAIVGFVLVALLAATRRTDAEPLLSAAGQTVFAAIFVGGAAAAIVLTLQYEIGAAITLLVLVGVYEASDYIVGSGGTHAIEGPLAGAISMAVVTFIVVLAEVPPFRGGAAWPFAGLAAVGCPLGQLVGSALLPAPTAPAPALRRLDSFLVLAPVWAYLIGLHLVGR
ncbi:MAG: hypothetical protein JWN46_2495, partial [Acidimicrobiales bacterium]|nr:hypothetical protein [Acidimicrobiales bacterium]